MTSAAPVRCHDCGQRLGADTERVRCADCLERRRAPDHRRKRARAGQRFPRRVRTRLLAGLSAGGQLGEVCSQLGVSTVQVYGWRQYDPGWADALDAALMAGRNPELDHGTPSARWWGCRCPDCRLAR